MLVKILKTEKVIGTKFSKVYLDNGWAALYDTGEDFSVGETVKFVFEKFPTIKKYE